METIQAETWLLAKLSGNTALNSAVSGRIYSYLAPLKAASPFVVFQYEEGDDENGVGGTRILTTLRYSVKVIAKTFNFATIATIANLIDTVLHGASGEISGGGYVNECIRVAPIAVVEAVEGDQEFRHLGGIYQLRISN